jgi:hypothetical protein
MVSPDERRTTRRRRFAAVVAPGLLGAAVLSLAGGCGVGPASDPRDGLEPDTARFTYGDRSVVVALDACGRDGDVVLAAGASGAIVLQVAADLGDDGPERTALTGDVRGDGIFGAFGAEVLHGPVGEISRVAVEGDRLTVEGMWAILDEDLTTMTDETVDGRVVVRCSDPDETAASDR